MAGQSQKVCGIRGLCHETNAKAIGLDLNSRQGYRPRPQFEPCHGRRRYAFPIRLSRGDDVKVGPRSSDDEVCLSYIYSCD